MAENWEPLGATMHDRMMELVRRYIGSAMQQATGMQGMMMRDAAGRMYPRIEATIRRMSEDELKAELNQVQAQIRQVIGATEPPAKSAGVAKKGNRNKTAGVKSTKAANATKATKAARSTKTRKAAK